MGGGGGGADPLGGGGGTDLRCVHFLAKMYAKMKEMDPVGGGGGRAPAAPPGSANELYQAKTIPIHVKNEDISVQTAKY